MKKIVCLLLTVAMLVSMIIIPTSAVEGNAAIRYNGAHVVPEGSWFTQSYCYINNQSWVKRVNNSADPHHGGYNYTMVFDFKVEDYGEGSDHFTDFTFAHDLGRCQFGYSFTHKAFVIYQLASNPGSDPNAGYTILAKMSYDLQLDKWYEMTVRFVDKTVTLYLNGIEMLVGDLEYLYNTVKGEDPVTGYIGTWDWMAREEPHRFANDFLFLTAVDVDLVMDNFSWYSGDYDIATGAASVTYLDNDGDFANFNQYSEDTEGGFAYWRHNDKFVKDPNGGTEKVTYNRGAAVSHVHEWEYKADKSSTQTCYEPGYDLYECINGCGASEQRNYVAAKGHAPGYVDSTLIAADENNSGVEVRICTDCFDSYTVVTPLTDATNGALHGYTNGGTGFYNGTFLASSSGELMAVEEGFTFEFDLMPIADCGKDFAKYNMYVGANGVNVNLGYDLYNDQYYAEVNGEIVDSKAASVDNFKWYRWDVVRKGLRAELYVDDELVVAADIPEEIYNLYEENGLIKRRADGSEYTEADCYEATFKANGCEFLMDNAVFADPDFDFANTRAGVIYDHITFNGDAFVNNAFVWSANNILAGIGYDRAYGAGYKIEAHGRPAENVVKVHSDRAYLLDPDYTKGTLQGGYVQIQSNLISQLPNLYDRVDMELTYDFYAFDWCTDEELLNGGSAFIGAHINNYGVGNATNPYGNAFAGYDLIKQQVVIGSISQQSGGYYGEDNTIFENYTVEKETWHNMSIQYKTEFSADDNDDNDFYVVSVWMDGNKILEKKIPLWDITIEYLIFFPNFVKMYMDNVTVKFNGKVVDDALDLTNYAKMSTTGLSFLGKDWSLEDGGYPTHVYDETIFPASCYSDGYTDYVCSCGESNYTLYNIPSTGHNEDAGTITVQPSGTSTGLKVYTCTVCGETLREEVLPKTFTYGDVNNSGAVDMNDVTTLGRVLNGAKVTGFVADAADVDANGDVNLNDYTRLLRFINGAKVGLGPQ